MQERHSCSRTSGWTYRDMEENQPGAPFLARSLREKWVVLPLVLPFLEHVLDRGFVDHHIRLAVLTVHLDAIPIIPFDDAVHFLAVAQNDHHRCPRLHLLLVIKILGVGLLRRRGLLASAAPRGPFAAIPTVSSIHAFSAVVPLRAIASFLRRDRGRAVIIVILHHSLQSRPNQLAVGEVFLFGRFTGWYGIHNLFHRGGTSDTRIRSLPPHSGTLGM